MQLRPGQLTRPDGKIATRNHVNILQLNANGNQQKIRRTQIHTSVSYTHLDVYKRQTLDTPMSNLKIWLNASAVPGTAGRCGQTSPPPLAYTGNNVTIRNLYSTK